MNHLPSIPPSLSSSSLLDENMIHCSMVRGTCQITRLKYTYPLKLISSKSHSPIVQHIHILNYGGGLVSGDHINLVIHCHQDASLKLYTQSTTKVFKKLSSKQTRQSLSVYIAENASLVIQSDPITCYENADYLQHQSFHLHEYGSLFNTDWVSLGCIESKNDSLFTSQMVFKSVYFIDSQVIMKESWSLNRESCVLFGYRNICQIAVIGPLYQESFKDLTFETIGGGGVFWSKSLIVNGKGVVIKALSMSTHDMLVFLRRIRRVFGMD